MTNLVLYVIVGIFFWLTSFFILFRAKDVAFYFLAAHFFIMGIGIFSRTVLLNNFIFNLPHVYGILSPLQFLYGPFYYFFLLRIFKKKLHFELFDLIHFVPFFFNLIDFIPFYVLPGQNKIELYYSNSIISLLGIPNETYEVIKICSYGFYLLLGALFYYRYIYSTKLENRRKTKFIHNWLKIDFILKLIAVLSFLFLGFLRKSNSFTVTYYLYSIDVFLNVCIIYLNPNLLNGIKFTYDANKPTPLKKIGASLVNIFHKIFSQENNYSLISMNKIKIIEIKNQCRDRSFDENDLAVLLKVNNNMLNQYITSVYECNAHDFIDYCRIQILTNMITKNTTSKHILKSLIYSSGFDSIVRFERLLYSFHQYSMKQKFDIEDSTFLLLCHLYTIQINPLFRLTQ